MRLDNQFIVRSPIENAWDLLMDVPRVAPCMPGTQLASVEAPDRWKALMRVQMGPIKMTFDVDLERECVDEARRSVVLAVSAVERRGRGNATATVTSSLTPEADGTAVRVETDVTLSGRVAQFARGIVEQVAGDMTRQFASNLQAELDQERAASPPLPTAGSTTTTTQPATTTVAEPVAPAATAATRAPAAPVRVDRMLGPAIFRSIAAFFRRLFRRAER